MPVWLSCLLASFCQYRKQWGKAEAYYRNALGGGQASSSVLYDLGYTLQKQKKFEQAKECFLAVLKKEPGHAKAVFRLGHVEEKLGRKKEALNCYEQALEQYAGMQTGSDRIWLLRFIEKASKLGFSEKGAEVLQGIIRQYPDMEQAHKAYESYLLNNYKWHLFILQQEKTERYRKDAKVAYDLGNALENMHRHEEAAKTFAIAAGLQKNDPNYYFKLGWACGLIGRKAKAAQAYAEAIRLDDKLNSKRFGIGVFYQQWKRWDEAEHAYRQRLVKQPYDAELWFKLGMAYDRRHLWVKAAYAYQRAVEFSDFTPYYHYRLGFVHERMEHWEASAGHYETAASVESEHKDYWAYRQGYVLWRAGRYEEACQAFLRQKMSLKAVNADAREVRKLGRPGLYPWLRQRKYGHTAHFWLGLGDDYARDKNWPQAAWAYQNAVDRSGRHNSGWHRKLGHALTMAGRYEEACRAFIDSRILVRPHGVDTRPYARNETLWRGMQYVELMETRPIREKTILYESFNGARMGCNPYALFQQILHRSDFIDFTHVWVVNDPKMIPTEYSAFPNVVFIARDSYAYVYYLATAKYLISNSTFPSYFTRRSGQRYLNTWHGIPLKTLGKKIPSPFCSYINTARNFLQTTHLLSPNPFMTDVLLKEFDIDGVYSGRVAETGYPRVDMVLRASAEQKDCLRKKLRLTPDKKVILYAPTWRGDIAEMKFDLEVIAATLERLSQLNAHVIFRGHYYLESYIKEHKFPVSVVGQEVDASELLSITDILVTDYSSIFFDFLPLKRPILFYAYDLELYLKERSLFFSMEQMPGRLCLELASLEDALADIICHGYEPDEKHLQGIEDFCPYEDGFCANRAVDFFFYDKAINIRYDEKDRKDKNLFFPGLFTPNGITESLLNLLSVYPELAKKSVLVIQASSISPYAERKAKFAKLPESVQVLGRPGPMLMSAEEKYYYDRKHIPYVYETGLVQRFVEQLYVREFVRLFGPDTEFFSLIQFEGYSLEWGNIFASARQRRSVNRVMWFHSDMYSEFTAKYKYLERMFHQYAGYDRLVSPSPYSAAVNRQNLAETYHISPEKFVSCRNAIDARGIFLRAGEKLDQNIKDFIKNRDCLINIGRLSVEKGQEKLIRAFADVYADFPDACLLIVGQGPLHSHLEGVVKELNLAGAVMLAGYRENPMPALRQSTCFVLSSNHEGQPVVLLEAMTLGLPIIATDIPASRGVLEGGYGLLVPNSEEGLADGMRRFLQKEMPEFKVFDTELYREEVLKEFSAVMETANTPAQT